MVAVAVAVFVRSPSAVISVMMSSVSVAPDAMAPTVQLPVPASYEPRLAVALTKASPAGSVSVTTTSAAVSGPLLATVTVHVVSSPTAGRESLTTFMTATSALGGATAASSSSLSVLDCGWSTAATDAVLVTGARPVTVAVMRMVAVAPLARVPTVHTPVAGT